MITFIKRWLEKRNLKKFQRELQLHTVHFPPVVIDHDEDGNLFVCSEAQWKEREKQRNSPLQKIIRSRGGYL
jgi:hypothetical protein